MLLLGRDRLFKYVKELDPIGLYNRTSSFTRRRGTYTTPRPDFCWSIDAYCKLEDFGFQIYAAINAETSRAAAHYGRTPHLIRVDKGKETLLLADGHFQHALRVRGPETTFTECFCFGTSVRNVRIESWWQQITRAGLGQWGRLNQGDPIDTEYIKALNETTKGWKIHKYLPKTTIEFCKDILRREGFPSGRAAPANFVQSLGKEEHEIAYARLRYRLCQLSDSEQASLEETLAPLGGRKWKPTSTSDEVLNLYKEHAEDEDQLLELNELFGDMAQLDFEGDGVDEEAAPEEFYQAYVEDWEDEDD
ncbi:unnamed protein product [Zymoseptoria tritici ST99CH_1A5]|uniref:Uncharacterized protein n=1 Tax=Zymoseptoria tritici ST99CH_1A5 TaxID=1276529 RepID=A0A1Y6L2U1_ZYMTR|nr:unnamed protein product [Zymoseptoria tritici ST99CH_1A5]